MALSSNQKSASSASPRRPYKPKGDSSSKKSLLPKRERPARKKDKPVSKEKPKNKISLKAPKLPKRDKAKTSSKAAPVQKEKLLNKSANGPQGSLKQKNPKQKTQRSAGSKKKLIISILATIGVLVIGLATFLILSYTSAFKVEEVIVEPTAHFTQEELDKIVFVDPEATLLNVDVSPAVEELKKNPWVASVDVQKKFPHTLTITINERKIFALALIGPENAAWYIGDHFHWIEPAKVETEKDEAVREAALQMVKDSGYYLIYDLPAEINPETGALVDVPVLQDVQKISQELSSSLASQLSAFSAPARDSISLRLTNGIEIAFGSAEDIASKEKVINAILNQHENHVTYINVRNPHKPTYRKIESNSVQ